jgi:ParB family chromosome partitioning protein
VTWDSKKQTAMNMMKKSPLGRGLGALIDDAKYEKKPVEEAVSTSAIAEIDIEKITENPFQPRTEFEEIALLELSESIKELGIIQPITVRKISEGKFQLISGERRLRASKLAGLTKIIAFVRDANDQAMLEMALVENIQREDLNAIEVAVTYQRLIDECQLTQDKLSSRVGKQRSTIANYLRLLKLPAEVQVGIRDKAISMGHARALINIDNPENLLNIYYKTVNEGLSVREIEKLIHDLNNPPKKAEAKPDKNQKLPEQFKKFKEQMTGKFPGKVDIKRNNAGKGSLIITFRSDEEFEKIKNLLS